MALGDQAKGLIQASKTRGWDPNIIPAGNGGGEVDISEFNVPPDRPNFRDMAHGPVPGGVPDQTRGMADGHDMSNVDSSHDDWNTHYQSEPKVRRGTSNANPYPAKPGAK